MVFYCGIARGQFATGPDGHGGLIITGYTGNGGQLVIPGTIAGLAVTAIGNSAFANNASLVSVTFPDSVTSLGPSAFQNSTLSTVTFGTGLITISDLAFAGTSLVNVAIPEGVTSLGEGAFSGCSLASITFSNSVTIVGGEAFYGCANLTSISFGSGVKEIGAYAFYQCDGLKSVTIPDNVTNIDENAFGDCNSLTTATLGIGIASIQSEAFSNCPQLQSVYFNANAPGAGNGIFANDAGDFTVYFYNSANFNSSNPDAPSNWIDASNDTYPAVVILPYTTTSNGDGGLIITQYTGPSTGTAIVPGSVGSLAVTGIGPNAFEYGTGLAAIVIPADISSIAGTTFASCSSLTQIDVEPENPTYSSLDGVLFNKNQSTLIQCPEGLVGTYIIPSSVTAIGAEAFFGCAGLTSISIPSTVTTIGQQAFDDCTGLTSVILPTSITAIPEGAFFECESLAYAPIPSSVTSIGDSAFDFCYSLGTVAIPDSVTSIGVGSFQYCSNLSSVTIGNGVTSIGVNAFEYCNSLSSVTLGNRVASIGAGAFENCGQLQTVTIPASVTSIGSQAFLGSTDYGTYGLVPSDVESAYFLGNAPTMGQYVFGYIKGLSGFNSSDITAYYLPEATGFASPTWTDNAGDTYSAYPGISLGTWQTYYGVTTNSLSATPLSDGVPNLLKYLFDIDPTVRMSAADRAALPAVGVDTTTNPGTTYLTLTYRKSALASGVVVNVQVSSDLLTWSTLTPMQYTIRQMPLDTGDSGTSDPVEQVEVDTNGATSQFIRLNVPSP